MGKEGEKKENEGGAARSLIPLAAAETQAAAESTQKPEILVIGRGTERENGKGRRGEGKREEGCSLSRWLNELTKRKIGWKHENEGR